MFPVCTCESDNSLPTEAIVWGMGTKSSFEQKWMQKESMKILVFRHVRNWSRRIAEERKCGFLNTSFEFVYSPFKL